MILEEAPARSLPAFLVDVARVGADAKLVERVARDRHGSREGKELEERWYRSLACKSPDFSVYEGDAYLGELWDCWATCSRKHLRALHRVKEGPLASELKLVRNVVDLGCGFGKTSEALAEVFASARVVATNIAGTRQWELAKLAASRRGFELAERVLNRCDLAFASEYFEHVHRPIDHLREVFEIARPRLWVVANAFGARAIGHFHHYLVGGRWVDAKTTSRMFNSELRVLGYEKVEVGLWNDRPAIWRRQSA